VLDCEIFAHYLRERAGVSMSKRAVYFLLVVLVLLHQDFWLWDDPSLVFGFLPVGFAYHAAYTLVVAGAWCTAIRYAWPSSAETFAEGRDEDQPAR